jgi:hypothetical protein
MISSTRLETRVSGGRTNLRVSRGHDVQSVANRTITADESADENGAAAKSGISPAMADLPGDLWREQW